MWDDPLCLSSCGVLQSQQERLWKCKSDDARSHVVIAARLLAHASGWSLQLFSLPLWVNLSQMLGKVEDSCVARVCVCSLCPTERETTTGRKAGMRTELCISRQSKQRAPQCIVRGSRSKTPAFVPDEKLLAWRQKMLIFVILVWTWPVWNSRIGFLIWDTPRDTIIFPKWFIKWGVRWRAVTRRGRGTQHRFPQGCVCTQLLYVTN